MAAQVVKRENMAVVLRTYEKDGETKKVWKTIGQRTTFQADDGSYFSKGELFHMPGADISFFEEKEREDNSH